MRHLTLESPGPLLRPCRLRSSHSTLSLSVLFCLFDVHRLAWMCWHSLPMNICTIAACCSLVWYYLGSEIVTKIIKYVPFSLLRKKTLLNLSAWKSTQNNRFVVVGATMPWLLWGSLLLSNWIDGSFLRREFTPDTVNLTRRYRYYFARWKFCAC